MMIQIIRSILSLVIVFGFIGCGEDSNIAKTTLANPTSINKAIFKVSKVQGNTVEYDSVATFTIKPSNKPSADISIIIREFG